VTAPAAITATPRRHHRNPAPLLPHARAAITAGPRRCCRERILRCAARLTPAGRQVSNQIVIEL
jgi:hypothetical protein